jgi:anti-sigma regulatory factor (Ser/Thr protein kinase)
VDVLRVDELDFGIDDLTVVRRLVADRAKEAGLNGRTPDLLLAVSELAANSIRHGGGSGTLRVWEEDGGVLCEVSDAGRMADPLAGLEAPGLDAIGSRGLWLVRQLCDETEVRSDDAGTVVRIRMNA